MVSVVRTTAAPHYNKDLSRWRSPARKITYARLYVIYVWRVSYSAALNSPLYTDLFVFVTCLILWQYTETRHKIRCAKSSVKSSHRWLHIGATKWGSISHSLTYKLRSALFWAITRGVVVIPYRRFGTTYRSRFKKLIGFLTIGDGRGRLS